MSLAGIDFARVKLVTFDVGGTLLTPHPGVGEVYAEILLTHGVTIKAADINKRFPEIFKKIRENRAPQKITEETEYAFWREVVQHCIQPECPTSQFESIYKQLWTEFSFARCWRPLPGAPELLGALAKINDRKIAVLSNWDGRLRSVLKELNWDRQLAGIFISSELGAEKPDLKVFRAVEQTMQVPPSACLHVGDSYVQDYRAALAAGWQATLYSDTAPANEPAAAIFNHFHDLIPYLT